MREIDRLAMEDFGISLAQMTELAGTNLAELAGATLGRAADKRVTVLAGTGNNAAGGLVAARHLANRGADVHVVLAQPVGRLHVTARERLLTLIEMDVPCCVAAWDLSDGELEQLLADSDLLIDALLGYSASPRPHGAVRDLVEQALASPTGVLSLDLPSGIDPDSGAADGVALGAAATMTIALPKRGLLTDRGRRHAGELYLADIGLPAGVYARAGLRFGDPFSAGPLARLD
ncbi:MAG: NAD(P)H-hydrate epimerase [Chloroflexota bacterium]|nr:NAD(P)H-hydrate epimerase [Chloroflexota bacterium]